MGMIIFMVMMVVMIWMKIKFGRVSCFIRKNFIMVNVLIGIIGGSGFY